MKNQKTNSCDVHKPKPQPIPLPSSNSQYNYPHLFKTAYGPHLKVAMTFVGPGRTKQSFKDECDINTIVNRFLKTGVFDATNKHAPRYGDCTGLEFRAGMETIMQAQEMFKSLPAQVRGRFDNDPGEFLDFIQNAENRDEARRLGLLKPEAPEATPLPTPPVSDAPTPPLASRKAMREQARADGERKADREQDY